MLRRSVRLRVALSAGAVALAMAGSLPLAQLTAQSKPLVTAKDLGQWESLTTSRLSPNGAWLFYNIARGNEEHR